MAENAVEKNVKAAESTADKTVMAKATSESFDNNQDDIALDTTESQQPAIVSKEKADSKVTEADVQAKQQAQQLSIQQLSIEPTQVASNTSAIASKAETGSKTNVKSDQPADDHLAKDDSVSKTPVALELTHAALFGKRYVTANKFGQASNDPRVVRQQLQSQITSAVSNAQVKSEQTVTAPVIRGTVGDFIQSTLPDAQTRLLNDGIIRSFIEAVSVYTEQAQRTAVEVQSDNSDDQSNRSEAIFDFSNYGYQPLAADYLNRFSAMTQAVSQFAAAQGKTAVEPRPASKRASNDPRGQHPDYLENSVSLPLKQAEPTGNTTTDSTFTESELDVTDVEADALVNQTQADDVSVQSEQLLQSEQKLEPEQQPVDTQPSEVQSQEVKTEADLSTPDVVMEAIKEDSQANKSKTTIASYKNMIENVAEQLLPQTGMFNLTTPKVPKARSRKPKSEQKKPAQMDKVEPENTDSNNE